MIIFSMTWASFTQTKLANMGHIPGNESHAPIQPNWLKVHQERPLREFYRSVYQWLYTVGST